MILQYCAEYNDHKVREYSFLEFSCNNSLHVAGNTSTFRLQCPPTGQFPTVHERPVLEDGNYSARFLSGVETETKVKRRFA